MDLAHALATPEGLAEKSVRPFFYALPATGYGWNDAADAMPSMMMCLDPLDNSKTHFRIGLLETDLHLTDLHLCRYVGCRCLSIELNWKTQISLFLGPKIVAKHPF